MPTFSYQALDVDGQEVAGTLEAGRLGAAVDNIRALGLFPSSIKGDAEAGALRRFLGMLAGMRFGKKSRKARIALFTRELADLLAGGVPLPLSIAILHDRQKSGRLKKILSKLTTDVDGGIPLSEAMAEYPETFGEFCVTMIQMGEDKGDLETAVQSLARFLEENNALVKRTTRRTGRSLLKLYAGFWVVIYLTRIIGNFIFMGGESSGYLWFEAGSTSNQVLRAIFSFMTWTELAWTLILLCGILSLLGMKLLDLSGPSRSVRDRFLLGSPFSGRLVKNVGLIQFTKAIGTLLAGGASLDRSLTPAIEAVGNRAMSGKLSQVSSLIKGGETVANALEKSGILAPSALSVIAAGEQTGSLDSAMLKVANIYDSNLVIPRRHFLELLFFASLFMISILFMTIFALLSLTEIAFM